MVIVENQENQENTEESDTQEEKEPGNSDSLLSWRTDKGSLLYRTTGRGRECRLMGLGAELGYESGDLIYAKDEKIWASRVRRVKKRRQALQCS